MSKQVSYARIAPFKEPFDTLYSAAIQSTDTSVLDQAIAKMTDLSLKITEGLNTAPPNVGRYFTWGTKDTTVDAESINDDIQIKLADLIAHSDLVRLNPSNPTPPSSLQSKVDSIPTPSTTSHPGGTQPEKTAVDLASGFSNMSANCWANSLLSMIVFIPNLRTAYETVANYHAAKSVYDPARPHGIALQNALIAYHTARALKTPVPANVTQDVRLAFNHFFGHVDPHSHREVFSKYSWAHEDAYEALQVLMGEYERIKREQNRENPAFSSLYCPLQTYRHYRPVGPEREPDPTVVQRDGYSRLSADNASRLIANDYQILLDLQNKGHLSFSALLTDHFRNTCVDDHDQANYMLPNGKVKSFKLTAEGRRFLTVPDELMLTIKRFGANMYGQGYKIVAPVMINRIIALPAEATRENKPIAYELDSFIVHSGGIGGGHYINYKKIDGRWLEADDSRVRFVETHEIDQILHGQRGAEFTSYLHHYTRVPQSSQSEALASAENAQLSPPSSSLLVQADVEKFTKQKLDCETAVKALETYAASTQEQVDPTNLNLALQELPDHALTTFRHAIWLNDKTPDIHEYGTAELTKNPNKIKQIRLPWLIGPTGATLLEQSIAVQKAKQKIAEEKLLEAQARAFLAMLNDPSVENENLILALKALPQQMQWSLHGLIYHSHKIKFGEAHVNKREYNNEYGKLALENGDLRKTLTEATESVLNLFGNNIVEQLVADHKVKAEKLQYRFEKEQLQAFRELLTHYPTHDLSPKQLVKAFERLEIRPALKEKLYWSIWMGHNRPNVYNYGSNKFNENPRCVLAIREPVLADAHICQHGSDILAQLIALLNKQSA
ncbi:MAG: ubiquitin carboxyl-terminal hydrolase [Verrucomicrobia bacterium]|nr:ubiquitin carboxyl-terminal hydrolase [Verrucomicrobiota bacterium]